jgi:hypothetical protein
MAYFAQVVSNRVDEVIVISDNDCGGADFPESEPIGQAFIASLGITGKWLQTSETGSFRGNYAGIAYTYDPVLDVFIAPITEEITE